MNIFSLTSLMIFFAGLGFGLFLFSSNRDSKINKSWFVVSIFTALWGLSLYGVTSTLNPDIALKWQYLLDISALMIPATYFSFVCDLLRLKNNVLRRFILYISGILAVFSVTPLFKTGVDFRYNFFWIEPGEYYIVFPTFFGFVILVALSFLIYGYFKNKNDVIFRAQIRNTLIAGIIGFGGGATNFFPQIINIYPFGNYFVLLYVFFMSYGVLKYKLLSKKVISAQLLSGAITLVFLFNLLEPSSFEDWSIKFVLFVLVTFFSIFLVRSVFKEVEQRERIEKLASELEKANDRLKELDQLKSEFLSLATHQIRAPLTAIKGYASLILDGDYGKISEPVKDTVQIIFDSCQNLVVIVNEFLDISRIEQGRMKYDLVEFDINKSVDQAIKEIIPNIEKAGLTAEFLSSDGSNIVYADQGKIRQIVGNILDNSIKYTPHGGIKIKIEDVREKVRVIVSDTGIGIAPEDIPKLFTKFTRAKDAFRTNVIGTGLGLYVAKQMMEAQNGKIWVESEGLGKGSTFFLEIPKKS